jgi:uncharacterized protein (DUF3084 family)
MKLPTRYEMTGRFWELKKRRDAQREKADPIRAQRDKLAVKQAKEMAKANEKVRAAEKGLADIEQEMAMLVRAVGGQMGEPAEVGAADKK